MLPYLLGDFSFTLIGSEWRSLPPSKEGYLNDGPYLLGMSEMNECPPLHKVTVVTVPPILHGNSSPAVRLYSFYAP